MTRWAYVDAPAGIAGDMLLGALVDAGLPLAVLDEVVESLGLEGIELRVERVARGALSATKVDVCRDGAPIAGKDDAHLPSGGHAHGRSLAGVLEALARVGDLETAPMAWAAAAFRALAEAEARVHGTDVASVHFHEVGAADALVDVAGACAGLHHLGVERVAVSPLPWGRGTVETAHGALPIPAPATALLLEGHAVVPSEESYEQVTPTGAALVRALARADAPPPGFVPRQTGFGAGTFDRSRLPNVVRLVIGDTQGDVAEDEAVLLETNLDDATGEQVAHALERALGEGALDAWWTAVGMKKGRPGVVLSVLARPEDGARLTRVLLAETPTLGVRRRLVQRTVLERRVEEVATPYGTVRMKVRVTPDGERAAPEFEDCRRLAERHGVALSAVQAAATRAWRPAPEAG